MKNKLIIFAIASVVMGVVVFLVLRDGGFLSKIGGINIFRGDKIFTTQDEKEIEEDAGISSGKMSDQSTDDIRENISPLPPEVSDALKLLNSDDWDDETSEKWLKRNEILHANIAEIIPQIEKSLRATPIERSWPRFELTYLLGELASEKALPILKHVIEEPIPDELLNYPKADGVYGGGTLEVKQQAVAAVMRVGLQPENKQDARDILTASVKSPYRSVRREAVMALKQLFPNDEAVKQEVLSSLPAGERYFYDLKVRHTPIPLSESNQQ